jgi:phage terminase large subunit-like protein
VSQALATGLHQQAYTEALDECARRTKYVDPWKPRHNQVPPSVPWRIWGLITGRGWGKNRVGAEWAHQKALAHPREAGFLAGRTLLDAVRTMVHHPESGLIATQKPGNGCQIVQQRGGGGAIVRWANGAFADIHSSEEPDRARGGHYGWGIADEVATWKRVIDFQGNTTWDDLQFALRGGAYPQMIAGTTPRRGSAIVKYLIEEGAKPGSGVVLSQGSLRDNAANLAPSALEHLLKTYAGTHLERQEIDGELLPDVPGAIVTAEMLASARVETAPELSRIVVGVDPSGGRNEQGIVAFGRGVDGHGYVLADRSGVFSPEGWGRRTVELYGYLRADHVAAERNYGGDMVESTIRTVDPRVPVHMVTASRGKHVRFEPIGSLFEQKRIHLVGTFEKLEDEICCFTPDSYDGEGSPNRADALVWAAFDALGLDEPLIEGGATW